MKTWNVALLLLLLAAFAFAQNETSDLSKSRIAKWQMRTTDFIDSSPIVVDDTVYIGSADGNLYAFEYDTGHEKWRFKTDGAIESSPAYYNGLVIVGSNDNNTYAVNATTGAKAWQYNTSGKVYSSPRTAGSTAYFGSTDGSVYALDARDGTYLWSFSAGDKIYSSPAIAAGIAYIGCNDGRMYALNSTNGNKLWEFQTGGAVFSSPKVANNVVYFGSYDAKAYAVDAFTGMKKWEYATGDKITASPELGRGIVWIGSTDGKLYAFNAFNGQLVWTFAARDPIESTPYYSARTNMLYFGSDDNSVYALNPIDGSLAWKYPTTNWVISTPAYYKGMLYFGSYDKNVYAVSTIVSYINYPQSGQEINGSTLTTTGPAFADAGIRMVEVKLNTESSWHTATGTSTWSYTFPIANLAQGTYVISVRTTDSNGDLEPESLKQVAFMKGQSPHAFQTPMVVTFPAKLRPGDYVRIEVKDDKGNPVPFVKVEVDGKAYYGDSMGVVDSDQDGSPIVVTKQEGELFFTVTKTDYYVAPGQRLAITVYKDDFTLYLAGGALAIIAVVGYYLWRKRNTPAYL